MVWACIKNRFIPYDQKCVNSGSKWVSGTRKTEVRLDGWCEAGLGQQRNDGEGLGTMSLRSERVDSPGTYVIK